MASSNNNSSGGHWSNFFSRPENDFFQPVDPFAGRDSSSCSTNPFPNTQEFDPLSPGKSDIYGNTAAPSVKSSSPGNPFGTCEASNTHGGLPFELHPTFRKGFKHFGDTFYGPPPIPPRSGPPSLPLPIEPKPSRRPSAPPLPPPLPPPIPSVFPLVPSRNPVIRPVTRPALPPPPPPFQPPPPAPGHMYPDLTRELNKIQ